MSVRANLFEIADPARSCAYPVEAGEERVFGFSPSSDFIQDVLDEVFVPVSDRSLGCGLGGGFSWPGCLSRGTVAIQAGAAGRDPVAQARSGVSEVAVPAERRRTVLIGVVGAQPMQVQCREFPEEFRVAMPVRRNDAGGKTVGAAEPVDPPVQLKKLGLQILCREQIPVDRMWRLRDVRDALEGVVGRR